MRLVACYDVSDDGRRAKLARALKRALTRVQRSTFEGEVDPAEYDALRELACEIVNLETDTVRFYAPCAACHRRTEVIGTGPLVDDTDDDVVV